MAIKHSFFISIVYVEIHREKINEYLFILIYLDFFLYRFKTIIFRLSQLKGKDYSYLVKLILVFAL